MSEDLLTHVCQVDSSISIVWKAPLPTEEVSGYFSLSPCCTDFLVFNANAVGPDQMPHSAASDLGLHCLQCPFNGMLDINGLRRSF